MDRDLGSLRGGADTLLTAARTPAWVHTCSARVLQRDRDAKAGTTGADVRRGSARVKGVCRMG